MLFENALVALYTKYRRKLKIYKKYATAGIERKVECAHEDLHHTKMMTAFHTIAAR